MFSPTTLVLSNATYQIKVYEVNRIGHLLVELNGQVLWEKSGYLKTDTALEEGEVFARQHHQERFGC